MKNPRLPRLLRRQSILCLTAAVTASMFVAFPASAQEAEDPGCTTGDLEERGESAALELAAACGSEVLIRESQDYTVRSFAQPDGSIATEFSVVPQWVPDETGEWVEADSTVEVADDGTIQSTATVSDLEFAAEGETEFVTATNTDGESVSLSWPEPLPEPVIEGDTVTYPEVLPDVDLEVYAGVADFSYALVVKTPEAAANPELERIELGLDTEGLSVAADESSDTASLTDASGEGAFSVASPWMWDSSETTAGAPELAAPMELEMDADTLAVIPDQESLTDSEAEYPIYIDPVFRAEDANFVNAFSQETGITCGTGSEMCTGFQGWSPPPDKTYGFWRSAMKFNGLQEIANRDVQQATVWITQRHTGDAGTTQTVRLAAMDWFDMSGDVSWNTFNDHIVGEVARDSVHTSNEGQNESDQRIEWADSRTASRIQTLVDDGGNTAVFAVISGANKDQEENLDYWRKLDPSTAKLLVWHGPLKPTNLYTDEQACSTSAPGPVINTLTPQLKLKAPVALEPNNTVSFYIYESGKSHPNFLQQIDVNDVADGATLTVSVDSGRLEQGKTYRWNARASDSDADSTRYSGFTSYCYFRVNSLPEVPTDLSTEDLGCGTEENPTLVTTRIPKLIAAPQDPDGGQVKLRFLFYKPTGDNIVNWYVDVDEGLTTSSRVAAGVVTEDGLYRWRAQTSDEFASSSKSKFCYLHIDTTAPEPPDVVQVTANPLPGDAVEFELLGEDGVTGFEYVLEGQTRQSVSAAEGQAKVSVTPSTSSVDHKLQVWAVDAAGNHSSPTTYWFTTIEPRPIEAVGAWRFDGDLLDDAGDHSLTPIGSAVLSADSAGRPEAAVTIDGTEDTCLTAGAPVVDTTDSFTIAAWAYTDATPDEGAAVVDVTGEVYSNMKLFLSASGQWGAAMRSSDMPDHDETVVMADASMTEFGTWTHVAAVYDAAAERLRVYVNGILADSEQTVDEPWQATGTLSVGCGVKATGFTFSHFTGSIDDAAVFQQPLTSDQIGELMTGQAMPSALQAWYPLRYDKTPGAVPGADYSGRATDLTGMPATPTWTEDQYGRVASALEFDGTTCPTAEVAPVRTDSAFSVSAWVRLDADHVNQHPRVFSFHGAQYFSVMAKYNTTNDLWNVTVTESDTAGSSWGDGAISSEVASQEAWTHIAVTVDPDNDLLQLFVNGELSDTGTIENDWDPWRATEFVIGCGGTADGSRYEQWDGAISDVRVWRGVLDADKVMEVRTEPLSWWKLGKDELGADQWGSNDLTVNGEYSWEIDRYNDCWAAYGLALDGTGWAETSGPVIATDESFTVAAWVRLDDLSDYRTIVAQSGTSYGAFNLNYSPVEGRFQLSMPQKDAEHTGWTRIVAQEAPVVDESTGLGKWYHLAAQVDLGAGVIRLYVDGELQGEAPVVDSPWQADGPLTIGAAEQLGVMTNQMVGAIDSVEAWSGVLDPLSIAALAADRPDFELDPDDADCVGSEEPPDDL